MALAYESGTDLVFDTLVLRDCGRRYGQIAGELRSMASELDDCLQELSKTGWTTAAGAEFHEMTKINWKENIEKYAELLETLAAILAEAAGKYEELISQAFQQKLTAI